MIGTGKQKWRYLGNYEATSFFCWDGAFYVMERGSLDFSRLHTLRQAGAYFVIRATKDMRFVRYVFNRSIPTPVYAAIWRFSVDIPELGISTEIPLTEYWLDVVSTRCGRRWILCPAQAFGHSTSPFALSRGGRRFRNERYV
jgi:hypothetical protein